MGNVLGMRGQCECVLKARAHVTDTVKPQKREQQQTNVPTIARFCLFDRLCSGHVIVVLLYSYL